MSTAENRWMLKWRLMGQPYMIPIEMLYDLPRKALQVRLRHINNVDPDKYGGVYFSTDEPPGQSQAHLLVTLFNDRTYKVEYGENRELILTKRWDRARKTLRVTIKKLLRDGKL